MEHRGTKIIHTDRLLLRPFCEADYADMYKNWASDPEVTRYLMWNRHTDPQQTRDWLRFRESQYGDSRYYGWCIVWKETGEAIGDISCVSVEDNIQAAELGWVIGREYWGRGIMPEAGRAVIDYLFDEIGLRRIWAYHDAQNPKSGRAMVKCGMRYEGTLRQAGLNKDKQIIDKVVYSILKTDARRKDAIK